MLKAKEERYEFSFTEQINGGGKEDLKGLAIDVLPKGDKDGLMSSKNPQIIIQSEDKGEGHTPYGYIEFKDIENLELFQIGLELMQQAIGRDSEIEDEVKPNSSHD